MAVIGIPITIFFGPAALGAFLGVFLVGIIMQNRKSAKVKEELSQTDEIITVITPTTNTKK